MSCNNIFWPRFVILWTIRAVKIWKKTGPGRAQNTTFVDMCCNLYDLTFFTNPHSEAFFFIPIPIQMNKLEGLINSCSKYVGNAWKTWKLQSNHLVTNDSSNRNKKPKIAPQYFLKLSFFRIDSFSITFNTNVKCSFIS